MGPLRDSNPVPVRAVPLPGEVHQRRGGGSRSGAGTSIYDTQYEANFKVKFFPCEFDPWGSIQLT